MSTVSPPPPGPPPPPPLPAGAAIVTVPQAPEVLLRLPNGAQIDVRMLETALQGRVEAESPLGKLLLRTPLPLAEGSTATLTMSGSARGQAMLRLTMLDGKPLAQALPDLLASARPGMTTGLKDGAALSSANVATSLIQRTPAMNAVVVRGLSAGDTTPTGLSTAAGAGAGSGVQSGGAAPPGGRAPAAGPATQAPLTGTPTGSGGASGAAPSLQLLPTGTQLSVRLSAFHPPGAHQQGSMPSAGPASVQGTPLPGGRAAPAPPGTATAAPTAGQSSQSGQLPLTTLNGTVASPSANGQVLVQTQAGVLALQTRADLPIGSTVVLDVTAQVPPPAPSSVPSVGPWSTTGFAGPPGTASWPALTDALDVLARSSPAIGQRLAAAMPQGDPNLTANVISFIRAARTNDLKQWTGEDPVKALEAAGPRGRKAAQKLSDDVRDVGAAQQRAGQSEWRALSIPFAVGGMIERITIVVRREDRGEDGDEAERKARREKGQRFLINLNLSRLGELQFDALYKQGSRQFDLMIRSRLPLAQEIRRDISAVFTQSAEALNLKGGVGFQVTDQFVGPLPDSPGVPGGSRDGLFV